MKIQARLYICRPSVKCRGQHGFKRRWDRVERGAADPSSLCENRRAARIRGEHRSESNDEEEICCELFHKSFCTCRDDPQIWNFEFATHKSLSKVISTLVSLVRCMRITRTLKAVCCMLYAGCCTLYAVRCILYTVWYMLYAVCFMLYDVCCVVYAVYCIFDVVRRLYAVCCLLYHVVQRFVL